MAMKSAPLLLWQIEWVLPVVIQLFLGEKEYIMLRKIYIDNYRCMVNFELEPDQISLLMVPNWSDSCFFAENFL